MDFILKESAAKRVQLLQAQLFPVCSNSSQGFLGSYLSNNLKTTILEVHPDDKNLRKIPQLKEPRELFALPKEKDYDCPQQQAARWPAECQVLTEKVSHIDYVPEEPEPFYEASGNELKPHPVGEENGRVVFFYNPVSTCNYINETKVNTDSESDDSEDDSFEGIDPISIRQSLTKTQKGIQNIITKITSLPLTGEKSDKDDKSAKNKEDNNNSKTCIMDTIKKGNIEQSFLSDSSESLEEIQNSPTTPELIFTRSCVDGSRVISNARPYSALAYNDLEFESRFESGNLEKAVKITATYYELHLRADLYTSRNKQWFYFRVGNTQANCVYRFSIVNLVKSNSLYNEGMRPLMYSTINAKTLGEGWKRCGENICYFRNDEESSGDEEDENASFTLTFNIKFPNDSDVVYLAHSYPYTYTHLQDYLMCIQRDPIKSKHSTLRLLCRTLAGNNVYYMTITSPSPDESHSKKKKAIVISARVHPGESPSSWMMKGLMDFITGESVEAKKLRNKFVFKVIPMLNPDGVIVGNTRYSLTGKDLNRQYRTVIRETYPSIWHTKEMIKRLVEDCGVALYCDFHGHSRLHNMFVYGCESRRNKRFFEQVFPMMLHKKVPEKFSFESCRFKVQRSKEGAGRITTFTMGVTNSYTLEASFGGSTMGERNRTHFNTADYEHMGKAFGENLLEYFNNSSLKVRKREKLLKSIRKFRKQDLYRRRTIKLKKLAEECGIVINPELLNMGKSF